QTTHLDRLYLLTYCLSTSLESKISQFRSRHHKSQGWAQENHHLLTTQIPTRFSQTIQDSRRSSLRTSAKRKLPSLKLKNSRGPKPELLSTASTSSFHNPELNPLDSLKKHLPSLSAVGESRVAIWSA